MQFLKKWTLLILIAAIVMVYPSQASATRVMLEIIPRKQVMSNWCWAACAQMIGECFGKSYAQGEIVEEIKGESVNEGGTLEELADAIKFTSKCSTKILKDTISFSKVKSEIRDSNPFAIRIFFDWEWRQHAVVDAGYDDESTNESVYILDPWTSGAKYYSYEALSDGTEFDGLFGTWTGTITLT